MQVKIAAEYIWLDGENHFRSKGRTLEAQVDDNKTLKMEKIPDWNYDGSSTGQAEGHFSEIVLKPRCVFNCPFRGGNNLLVWCETFHPDGSPTASNTRVKASELFNQNKEAKPWFGLEQEYFLMSQETNRPLGFPATSSVEPRDPEPQGPYYCGVGANRVFGRQIAEMHYKLCLRMGLKLSGINAEVAPGQWEFQVGPCEGIESGDHLWMARYLLERVAESHGVGVEYHPKPVEGDWNGSGCHTNYSTVVMREGTQNKTGLEYIHEAVDKLSKNHEEHMAVYGKHNEKRMTGKHETCDYATFKSGTGDRGASIRIPNLTAAEKKGYFEDRRPSSNCDPYLVTSKIFETTVLRD